MSLFIGKELREETDFSTISTARINTDIVKSMIKPRKGTTTLAFIFKEGMIVAVDSRATAGSYIASQTVKKVIEINDRLLGTMAGGAADCYYWETLLGLYAKRYELDNGERITPASASMYLRRCMLRYRGNGLSMSTMICGYDKTGPKIYNVTDDGARVENHIFSVGSGSTIALGVLSARYKYDMSKEEAIELGKDAIFHAGHRDAASGGRVNLYFMDENGWVIIGQYDLDQLALEKNIDAVSDRSTRQNE